MDVEWEQARRKLREARALAEAQGGSEAIARAHARGKRTARERLDYLLDAQSFQEIGLLVEGKVGSTSGTPLGVPADNVVCGWGEIDGRRVCVVADDGTRMGGAASILNVEKRFRLRHLSIEQGCPFIGLYEGSAIRFQDSMDAGIMARIPAFKEILDCAGEVPQLAAVLGPAYGRPPMDILYSDFSVQAQRTGYLGLSGPALVEGGIGEKADIEALSGTSMTVDTTGLVDRAGNDEIECLDLIREALSYFPASCASPPPRGALWPEAHRAREELVDLVPSNPRRPYDMKRVVAAIADAGTYLEYKPTFARSLFTAMARFDGHVIGVVANQPLHKGGVLDSDACLKMRRFIQVCNAFHIPLLFLEDQPGFMIGEQAERDRILYWAGGLLGAVERAVVPMLTIVLRKAHGAAVWTMGGQPKAGNLVVAWPITITTGTGPSSAVNTMHARELAAADNPKALRAQLEAQYSHTGSALRAAATFGIDDVIDPADTGRVIGRWLELAVGRTSQAPARRALLFP